MLDEVGVSFVVGGVEVDKALGFNKEAFAAAYFCFTNISFSLFCSHCFFNTSYTDRQYFFSSVKVASS